MNNVFGGSANDERPTPPELFHKISDVVQFTIDVASTPENALCARSASGPHDPDGECKCGLCISWEGEIVWCNPPYSNIAPWVEKAAALHVPLRASLGDAVLLLPLQGATIWAREAWYHSKAVVMLSPRVQFINGGANPKDNALFVFGRGSDVRIWNWQSESFLKAQRVK